jgi:hypothetical protein
VRSLLYRFCTAPAWAVLLAKAPVLTLLIDRPCTMLTTNDAASIVSTNAAATRTTPKTKPQLAAAKLGLLLCRAPTAWPCMTAILSYTPASACVFLGTTSNRRREWHRYASAAGTVATMYSWMTAFCGPKNCILEDMST